MTGLLLFFSVLSASFQLIYLIELKALARRVDNMETVQAEQAQKLYRHSSVFNEISLKLFKR